jgi:hypothetical protein
MSASAQTWTVTSAPGKGWTSIAMSADGRVIAAADDHTGPYVSTNGGISWTSNNPASNVPAGTTNCSSVAVSPDGNTIVALFPPNFYGYISTNTGASWVSISNTESGPPYYTIFSADGDLDTVRGRWRNHSVLR